MRKIFTLSIISVLLLLYLAGCGGSGVSGVTPTGVTPTDTNVTGSGSLKIDVNWDEVDKEVTAMQKDMTGQVIQGNVTQIYVQIWTVPVTTGTPVYNGEWTGNHIVITRPQSTGTINSIPAGRCQVRFYALNTNLTANPPAPGAAGPDIYNGTAADDRGIATVNGQLYATHTPAAPGGNLTGGTLFNVTAERYRFVTIKPDEINSITAKLGVTISADGTLEPQNILIDDASLGKTLLWTNESFTTNYYLTFDRLLLPGSSLLIPKKDPNSPGYAAYNSLALPATPPSTDDSLVTVSVHSGSATGPIVKTGTINFIGSGQVKFYRNGILVSSHNTITEALTQITNDTPVAPVAPCDYKVQVSAGTYTGQITIPPNNGNNSANSIELVGAGAATTILQSANSSDTYVVEIDSAATECPVYIHGFTIQNTGTHTAARNLLTVDSLVSRAAIGTLPANFGGATINIGDNIFKAKESSNNTNITTCIQGVSVLGSFVVPAAQGIDIHDNTFNGLSNIGGGFTGINLAPTDDATAGFIKIRQNTLSGRIYEGIIVNALSTLSANCITTVSSNTVRTTLGPALDEGNDVQKSWIGIYLNVGNTSTNDLQLLSNKVNDDSVSAAQGFRHGISFATTCGSLAPDSDIHNNTVIYNTYGFTFGANVLIAPPGSGLEADQVFNHNNITNNSLFGAASDSVVANAITGEYNWWGSAAGPGFDGANPVTTFNIDTVPVGGAPY